MSNCVFESCWYFTLNLVVQLTKLYSENVTLLKHGFESPSPGTERRRYSNGANCASRHFIASPSPLLRRISSNVEYSGVPVASSRLQASTPYWSAARSPIVTNVLFIARLLH